MKTFLNITKEEVAGILNTAMDDGDWHTPTAHDINLHNLSNAKAAYGWFNISRHNRYHDKEMWFNINNNTVQIWEKKYVKGKADISLFRPIYNIEKLSDALKKFNSEPSPKPVNK